MKVLVWPEGAVWSEAMWLESVLGGSEDYKLNEMKYTWKCGVRKIRNLPQSPTKLSADKAALMVLLVPGFNKKEERVE